MVPKGQATKSTTTGTRRGKSDPLYATRGKTRQGGDNNAHRTLSVAVSSSPHTREHADVIVANRWPGFTFNLSPCQAVPPYLKNFLTAAGLPCRGSQIRTNFDFFHQSQFVTK